jgi:cytochrome c oxidase cbb3-type subunit I/II
MITIRYDDSITRKFLLATVIWGFVGMLVGVIIALQLSSYKLNFDTSWLTFGRLRPLHTNAVIFAFAGNAIFAGIYYSTQRLCKARMFSDLLSNIHFWGWQLIIVAAAVTLPLGLTQGKEYAELEWPIDIAITLVWVAFAINFFGTLIRRREKHMYVALWFYMATIVTIAVLHITNSLVVPLNLFKSYSVYAGVQDALVQWWYGHNAVGFFLTTPFLGLMYYFLPKAANRPIYSYRLSILHFWGLVFLYIWTGPHHLHYTALPDWAQSLGAVFSVMLLAPSWGGMINGLLTVRGAWHKLRTDPILKFMVAAITFYGMATFEGPLMSIKGVNSLSHYTDWTIGHVHSGALGWNGFLACAMIYWLLPKLWNKQLYSTKLANAHFWLGTLGIVFYAVALWIAGITQGLMWKEFNAEGMLTYPNFIETLTKILPMYWVRTLGGTLYLLGYVLMMYNIFMTIKGSKAIDEEVQVSEESVKEKMAPIANEAWHSKLEGKPMLMAGLTAGVISIGGIIELVPTFVVESNVPTITAVKPYTPLELEGRDIYVREGCYLCHSQMVRPFRDEVARYGEYSKAGEFVYDHPFQWGSKRTGPDLARLGGKYSNMWQLRHMENPRSVVAESNMPNYGWLLKDDIDYNWTEKKIETMQKLGVPYTKEDKKNAVANAQAQAKLIADDLASQGAEGMEKKEIVALIAYLQRLGTDIGWRENALLSE